MRVKDSKPNHTGRASGKVGGRNGKLMKPPAGEPWCWLTRELVASPAWRSLGINARRFMDFLMIEHMNHAGTENGQLKATYKQLETFGLSANHIARAIADCEDAGLIDCYRGGMRVATTYTLTWLSTSALAPASNRWKGYKKTHLATPQIEGRSPPKQRADSADLPPKQRADATPQTEGPIYILEDTTSKTEVGPRASDRAGEPVPHPSANPQPASPSLPTATLSATAPASPTEPPSSSPLKKSGAASSSKSEAGDAA
jgi:hypothetical protein